MNQRLRNTTIKSKLVALTMTSVALALVMAVAGLVINDYALIRKSKVDQLEAQAQMLGFNCTGVLTFQDFKAAEQLLSSLSMYPTVDYACLYDETGESFASYRADHAPETNPQPLLEAGHRFAASGHIDIYHPVWDGDQRVGAIYLHANLSDLNQQLASCLWIGGLVIVASLATSAVVALRLQKSISDPIRRLAEAAKDITVRRDFSIRVKHDSSNELGQLCRAFNEMLDELQASKAALQGAHDELEERVEQRTSQLTAEIEQRQTIQEALEKAKDQAEAASKAKSEFLANMSHEIRTPLNGILGFTELLEKGTDGGDAAKRLEYLETISTSGQHLLSLINDILDLSKIEAGQLDIDLSPCSPHDIINQVVSVLRVKAQQKGLDLSYGWSGKVPETIITDSARFRQVLINVVGNAIKFTDRGSVTIDGTLDEAGQSLTIRVIDTGIGIPDEKQRAIFDPFVQADNSVTRRYGGTGLGLAICRRLSKALGGDLIVESQPSEGSIFTLTIDTGCLKDVTLLDAPPADALKHGAVEAVDFTIANANVLLVEDGAVNRKLVKTILEEAGARVTTAENGWVGVQLANKQRFDLILMDMQMPVMDGYAAANELRDQGLTTPIVALTAHAMKGDEQKCLDAGCTEYLTKPIQSAALLNTVGRWLHGENASSVEFKAPESDTAEPADGEEGLVSTLPDKPIFREIIVEFIEFLNEEVDAMRTAYEDRDLSQLVRLAHALKGAGGTAGFDVLTRPAAQLEQAARNENVPEINERLADLTVLAKRITATPQFVTV